MFLCRIHILAPNLSNVGFLYYCTLNIFGYISQTKLAAPYYCEENGKREAEGFRQAILSCNHTRHSYLTRPWFVPTLLQTCALLGLTFWTWLGFTLSPLLLIVSLHHLSLCLFFLPNLKEDLNSFWSLSHITQFFGEKNNTVKVLWKPMYTLWLNSFLKHI